MNNTSETATKIMDAAEGYIRTRGYNAFSFRDIAADVGIKTASIHYHFPTKGDLGAAVAERYTERFMTNLGPAGEGSASQQLHRYVDAFRTALALEDKMCLCGMLGAELSSLPENVVQLSRAFFTKNLSWLTAVFLRDEKLRLTSIDAQRKSLKLLALLEGGLILSRNLEGVKTFDQLTEDIFE
ncbi:TetR/AcrR family transcriptional regulator [Kiloniella laminariae]|uniref:TetR/AcrR family transcriptional regulator n=1 Tax=Kiloniella laminariae TaxID=454162 RepID=A0ABT4LNT0_9PROT|nr:TetR/AcrR family transcriptional regulator [Kiloniella laminariae]MCZ4282753.1 TetR/AcrR family transcriptional regulator [Kiloniella laminariae]